ncbi:MAG: hypothetical protein HQK99_15560 [Nitrospirae bacterium]|nr:hypothetical protein [Nitrospirota bacterium]
MSDAFGSSTQQNILTGGDGAKLYGWYAENTSNTSVFDVNNASGSGAANCLQITFPSMTYTDAGIPFFYRKLQGDFDVNTKIQAYMSWAMGGLIVKDELVNPGHLNYVKIDMDGAENLLWYNITNDSVTNSGSGATGNYLRINRTGNVFTIYSSTNGSSWTQQAQWTRGDFSSTVYVGLHGWGALGYAGVYNQFAYFDGTYTDAGGSITASSAVTLPPPTVSAASLSSGTGSAAVTLPHLIESAACSETGNFCDNALPVFQLDGEFAAQADVEFNMPVFIIDSSVSGSNVSFGLLYGMSLRTSGSVITGAGGYGNPKLPVFTVKSQMAAKSALTLPCFQTDIELLTGRIASTRVLRLPRFKTDTLVYNPPIINGGMRFPVVNLAAKLLTGAGCEFDELKLPAIRMPSLAYVNAYAGGISTAAAALKAFTASTSGYGEYKGKAAVAVPLFAINALAVESLVSFSDSSGTKIIVLNINTGALTEYTAYDFNGFCQWGDGCFAEGDGGIYIIGADTDDGASISCSIKTSKTELKNAKGKDESSIKRVPEVHTVVRTPSPFVFKAITDDGAEHVYLPEFTEAARTDRTTPQRIKLGKGARGRYWQFAIENTAGAPLEIESFEPEVAAIGRRV